MGLDMIVVTPTEDMKYLAHCFQKTKQISTLTFYNIDKRIRDYDILVIYEDKSVNYESNLKHNSYYFH